MPLPTAFRDLFKGKEKPALLAALVPPNDAAAPAAGSGRADARPAKPTDFALHSVRARLAEIQAQAHAAKSDVTQVHASLAQLYQLSHTLENAIAAAQSRVAKVADSRGPVPGFDCSLEELNETFTEVANNITHWLDILSSGPPEIDAAALRFDIKRDLIGEGAFGKVYKGSIGGTDVAIKIPNDQLEGSSTSELEEVRQEIRMLRKIFHPNVVLLLGACTSPGKIRIVFELMKTSVKSLISSSKYNYAKKWTGAKKLKLLKDVAKGIAWLHSPSVKIIHRDLKLDNLMVDFNDNGKVCDFGLGILRKSATIKDTIKGNLLYRAPELMAHSRGEAREVEFTEMIDVYAFGILMWEIYRGEEWYPPHPYDEPSSYCDFVCNGKRPELHNTRQVNWPPLLVELIAACWAQDPKERPSMEETVQALTGVEYEHWKARIAAKISTDVSRQFWLKHFAEPQVPWSAMRAAVSRATGLSGKSAASSSRAAIAGPAQRFGALRALLCCDWSLEKSQQVPSDHVTIEAFNVAQAAFGPFFDAAKAANVLAQIDAIVPESWFHGYISRQTAEERLKVTHRDVGTFLVRVSVTQANVPFVISYVGTTKTKSKAIHHLKVMRPKWDEPTLVMDGAEYQSLHECVQKGRERKILLAVCETSVPVSAYDESM